MGSIYLNGLSITPIISAEKAFFQMPTAISASKKDNIHILNDVVDSYPLVRKLAGKKEVYALFENDLPDTYTE